VETGYERSYDAAVAEDRALNSQARWSYRPHLDGLRAVAVYLVVLFHAAHPAWDGGFIGVDMFFVLSGFVVTGVLLSEIDSKGQIDFWRFYARRAKRLLPAAAMTLLVVSAALAVFASPFEQRLRLPDVISAAVYVSNWNFVAQATDYFGADITASPILHFWSLSVEEQFYLIWPAGLALFVFAARKTKHAAAALAAIIGILMVLSAVAAVRLADDSLLRAYYGTDTRGYQLLTGALLATHVRARRSTQPTALHRILSIAAMVAIIAISTPLVDALPTTRGLAVTVATGALIWATEGSTGSPLVRFLSTRPVVWLGKISYGTYLWHWPIAVVLIRTETSGDQTRWIPVALLSTAVAALSHRYLEMPIRRLEFGGRANRAIVASGLTLSVLTALGAFFALRSGPSSIDWQAAADDTVPHVRCPGEVADCMLVNGTGPRLLLTGDSHAAHRIPALSDLARIHGFQLFAATQGSCPWPDVPVILDEQVHERCEEFHRDLVDRTLPGIDPDLVILASAATERRPVADGEEVHQPGTTAHVTAMVDGASRILDEIERSGAETIILEQLPRAPGQIPECLSDAALPASCDFDDQLGTQPVEEAVRELVSERRGVALIDVDAIVCPRYPRCTAMTPGGTITLADASHLTATYSREIAPDFWAAIEPHQTHIAVATRSGS
jgi:peptidoglycan/LPS O-acetylase OafA/YrhL